MNLAGQYFGLEAISNQATFEDALRMIRRRIVEAKEALSRVKSGDLCESSVTAADRMTFKNHGPMEDLPGYEQAPWGFLN